MAFGLAMEGEQDLPDLFLFSRGNCREATMGECVGLRFQDDPRGPGELRIGVLEVLPDETVHGRPVHQAAAHGQNGVVMAVGVQDFREKIFGLFPIGCSQ